MTVVMYPEGTITADPLHWPMTGRTGAARLALETGVPVIPVGQWGPQEVMGYKEMTFPKLWPRKTMKLYCGTDVELSDLRGRHDLASVRRPRIGSWTPLTPKLLGLGGVPTAGSLRHAQGARIPKSIASARPVVDPH